MAATGAATSYSGTEDTDDSGSFGVVFSSCTGPPDVTSPTVVYVHLVLIEGIEGMTDRSQWPIKDATSFVALPSLYSRSYVCLPKGTVDVRASFDALRANIDVLGPLLVATTLENKTKMADYRRRAASATTGGFNNPEFTVADNVLQRIDGGYSATSPRRARRRPASCTAP